MVGPLCQLGCADTDPAPSEPGIFLGNDITLDYCLNGEGTDADGDGLTDYCEQLLSMNFRPELRYSRYHDDIRGERYWVARPDGTGHILVGYLFAYYRDLGSVQWGCAEPHYPGEEDWGCHNGDSESIWQLISYVPDNHHWLLNTAYYSHHKDWNVSSLKPRVEYADVDYPTHPGAYPRAWVAEQKHANYLTQNDCGASSYFGHDDCTEDDTLARFDWGNSWNIGSQSHPFIDVVTSRDPSYEYYGLGRTESFWTDKRFRGWVPDSIGGGDASSYHSKLVTYGFAAP